MSYSEELVESLLPSVWDSTYAWGVQSTTSPDADMPKAKYVDPRQATAFWTHLIDVRRAWEIAPITMPERRVLLLAYGLGWTAEEIAFNQGVSVRAINKRRVKGVDCMAQWLNATDFIDHEDTLIGTS